MNGPCLNTSCKSYGKVHPHCNCGSGRMMAEGGEVQDLKCEGPHKKDCPHYFSEGGDVPPPPKPFSSHNESPSEVLNHAAVNGGLVNLLKNAGHSKLLDSGKHDKVLHEMREQHADRANPLAEKKPKTHGRRLGEHIANGDFEAAAEHMSDHPLVGHASKERLAPIMERLAQPLIENEPHPEAMRSSVDFLHGAMKGKDKLDQHIKTMLGPDKTIRSEPDEHSREKLKKHMDDLQNPEELLKTGGSLGHYLPEHAGQMGAFTSQAKEYLSSIKPQQSQNSPLDRVAPADPLAVQKYNRALDVVQNPLMIIQQVKDGTLRPSDVSALQAVYPDLHQSIVSKAGLALIEAKAKGTDIPYAQRLSLSLLTGSAVDSTLTQKSLATIQSLGASKQGSPQAGGQSKPRSSTAALKSSEKLTDLYETPQQSRIINKKQ